MFVDIKAERERDRQIRRRGDVVDVLGVLGRRLAGAIALRVGHDVVPEHGLVVVDSELQIRHVRLDLARDVLQQTHTYRDKVDQHNRERMDMRSTGNDYPGQLLETGRPGEAKLAEILELPPDRKAREETGLGSARS